MARVLILADDLSGAADASTACMRPGLSAEVLLGSEYASSGASIVAVDADTRCLTPGDAAEHMYAVANSLAANRSAIFFKKIDSTLRGHFGPELAAVLAARRVHVAHPIAIVAPAFPANGRTTVGGVHHLHGRPLHQTEMWQHERIAGEANIAHMLLNSGLRCSQLDLKTVRNGLASGFPSFQSVDAVVCDAVTDEDLTAIARLALRLGERAVWVGSAGLAQVIPEAAGMVPSSNASRIPMPPPSGPALFVIGSVSPRTREQVAALLSSAEIHDIVVPPETLLRGPGSAQWLQLAYNLSSALRDGEDVILRCYSEPRIQSACRPQLAFALAELTAGLRGQVGTLVASGGETARKVLDRWSVHRLQLHGELELGVPISSVNAGGAHDLTVITKAGDFGRRDTLLHCLHWINAGGMLA